MDYGMYIIVGIASAIIIWVIKGYLNYRTKNPSPKEVYISWEKFQEEMVEIKKHITESHKSAVSQMDKICAERRANCQDVISGKMDLLDQGFNVALKATLENINKSLSKLAGTNGIHEERLKHGQEKFDKIEKKLDRIEKFIVNNYRYREKDKNGKYL